MFRMRLRGAAWILVFGSLIFPSIGRTSFGRSSVPESTRNRTLAERILADPRFEKVEAMGAELLRSGLNAGTKYAEVWIRDLNTFIVPALGLVPKEIIRDSLLVFFHFQQEDGNVPDGYVPSEKARVRYKYRTATTQPDFRAHKNTVETDQESSLVQAVCRYVKTTGDGSILEVKVNGQAVRDRLIRALEYPLKQRFSEKYGLVWGATTADWGDVQPEHQWGVELDENSHRAIDIYDNALLSVAIEEFLQTAVAKGSAEVQEWTKRRDALNWAIREHLWDERNQKFIPHLYLEGSPFEESLAEDGIYYQGGTAVAIEAGLLSREEILVSYGQMKANLRLSGAATLGLTLYPAYPDGSFKNPSMKPYSYQNGGDWTWFGARMVRQLARFGFAEEAYRELSPMLDRVLLHEGFYEWWTVGNEPRGSGSFRGSAGVLIEAMEELRAWAIQVQNGRTN